MYGHDFVMITSMTDSSTPRDHTKDFARLVGCVAVIVCHSVLAYAHQLPTDMLWPIRDMSESEWLIGVFYHTRFVGVGLFMFLAGELTRRSLEKKPTSVFMKVRARRLARLILIGLVTTLPLTYLIWAADAVDRDYIKWEQFFDFRLSDADKSLLLGPAHLWFLEYLLIITSIAAILTNLLGSTALLPRKHAIPLLMFLMFACAWLDPTMMTGFRNSFVPRPSFLIFNACIFAAGWLFAGVTRLYHLGIFLSLALLLIRPHHANDSRLFLAACAALCIPAIIGTLALCNRLNLRHAIIRKLSDLSPVVYIAHLPIVCAVQYALKGTELPVPVKISIVTLATLVISACCALLLERCSSRPASPNP